MELISEDDVTPESTWTDPQTGETEPATIRAHHVSRIDHMTGEFVQMVSYYTPQTMMMSCAGSRTTVTALVR